MQTLGDGGRRAEIGKCLAEESGGDKQGATFFFKKKRILIKELVLLYFPMSNTSLVFIKMMCF